MNLNGCTMTLTDYARRRGCSTAAVSKAVATGRLTSSVGRDAQGRPTILDPDAADREWDANTRARVEYIEPSRRDRDARRPLPRAPGAEPTEDAPTDAGGDVDQRAAQPAAIIAPPPEMAAYYAARSSREEADARSSRVKAEIAELRLRELRGEMMPVDVARADMMTRYARVKTRLLGLPRTLGQRVPHLAAEVVPLADELVREALAELADGDGAAG